MDDLIVGCKQNSCFNGKSFNTFWIIACGCGSGIILCLSPSSLNFTLLAPIIGLAFFYSLVRHSQKKELSQLRYWWISGTLFHVISYHWIPFSFANYTGQSLSIGILLLLAISSVSGLLFLFPVAINRAFNKATLNKPKAYLFSPLWFASSWYATEVILPRFTSGGPGLLFFNTPIIQSADLLGLPGVSSIIIILCTIFSFQFSRPLEIARSSNRPRIYPLATLLIFGLAFICYGIAKTKHFSHSDNSLNAILIQPNFDTNLKPNITIALEQVEILRELTFEAIKQHTDVDLIVWPESSFLIDPPKESNMILPGSDEDPMPGLHIPLLYGTQVPIPVQGHSEQNGSTYAPYYNSAFLKLENNQIAGRYHKRALFPFSEKQFGINNNAKSSGPQIIEGPSIQEEIFLGNTQLSLAICYDDLWTNLFNSSSPGTNQLFISILNDSWLISPIAKHQHELLAALRTIEYRRSLLRVSNSGVTNVRAANGENQKEMPLNTKGYLYVENIPLFDEQSLYGEINQNFLKVLAGILLMVQLSFVLLKPVS